MTKIYAPNKVIKRIALIIPSIGLLTTAASAADTPFTQAARTDTGCIFYTYPEYEITQARWHGQCTANKEITGRGELIFEARLVDPKEGFLGKRSGVLSGEMRNGLLQGKGSQTRIFFDKNNRKERELWEATQFVGGVANGPGERVVQYFRADNGKLATKKILTGKFKDDVLTGSGRIITEKQSAYSQGNIEEGIFENGQGKQTSTRFLKTLLGGDMVFAGINYELPSGKPLNQTGLLGLADKDVLVGYVERPAGKLPIRVRKSNFNTSFLNEFEVFRENWSIVCYQPEVETGTLGCTLGEIHVKTPKFDYTGQGIVVELDDLDSNNHPARQVAYFVEREKANQEAFQARRNEEKTEAQKNLLSEESIASCIRDYDRFDADEKALEREWSEFESDGSSLSFLASLIESTRSAGFSVPNDKVDSYNNRVRERNDWAKSLRERTERHKTNGNRMADRCSEKNVSGAQYRKFCTNSSNSFCESLKLTN